MRSSSLMPNNSEIREANHDRERPLRHRRLLTGWGHSQFGKLQDETLETLIVQVARAAIESSGIEAKDIDEIYLGQFNSGLLPAGLRLIPCTAGVG